MAEIFKGRLKKETEDRIMAAQDKPCEFAPIVQRGKLTNKMCLQSVECAEKGRRQLAILYRNAKNLLKSNIDVKGTTTSSCYKSTLTLS